MSTDANHSDEPGSSQQRPEVELQCIGSFKAYSQDAELYTIEIWTRFEAQHDRERLRIAPGFRILTTTDGRRVERVDQGEYRLVDNPEVSLSTDDPNAP